jgi:hypothetical protein
MALCASLLAVGLAGCETAQSLFGSSSDTPTASVANPPPAAATSRPAQIALAPVIGPPENVSKDLQTQLMSSLEGKGIRVAKAGEKADYTLRGYVVSSLDKKGAKAKISYIWDVTDGTGKGVHRVSGEESAPAGANKDPWASITPPVIEGVTAKTVTSLASWLPAHSATAVAGNAEGVPVQSAAATPSSTPAPTQVATGLSSTPSAPPPSTGSIGKHGAIAARVPSVTGAPGDGSSSLRSALQRELARNGVALSDTPSPSTYTVEGKVALGAGADGKQPITIDWSVTDPDGKKLGTVSQKNEVPQGSLDSSWGKTADAAAAAAAQGILKLLPQATQTTSTN